MTGLCVVAGDIVARVALVSFTLAWEHSVEKVRWEEDWIVAGSALVLVESRVKGSGAGMEPPEWAVLRDGSWHYRGGLPPQERLELARSGTVPDWEICTAQRCQALASYLPSVGPQAMVTLRPCAS